MTNINSNARPGRPREFDESDVLSRAATAFLKDGFEAASYENIAKDVGLSKPSLYNSFGNKTALFERVLADYAIQAHDHLIASFSDAGSLRHAIEAIFDTAARFYAKTGEPSIGCLLVGTALPSMAQNSSTQKCLSGFAHRLKASLRQVIRAEYRQDSNQSGATPEETANHICNLIFALAVQARMGLSQRQLRRCARDLAKLVV